mgnify:FL=1|jgi:hypothetical protein
MEQMKTLNCNGYLPGFVSLDDNACCAVTGGMTAPGFDSDLAYMLGEILGQAFRVLYDLGANLIGKLKKTAVPA